MIPGTIARSNSKISSTANAESISSESERKNNPESANDSASKNPASSSEITNPARREMFAAILPAIGSSLVEILRASNNLKRDMQEAWDNSDARKD